MKILIPLAGNGQRFKDDGYKLPKPLIKVLGVPLCFPAIGCLKEKAGDEVWVAYREELDEYDFRGIVTREFAHVKFVTLKYPTRGPVETVLCALQEMGDLLEPVLVMDGDTFYENDDIVERAHNLSPLDAVFYFKTQGENPIYSYIKTSDSPLTRISEIKEKEKISDMACSGAYLFSDGKWLKKYCEKVLTQEKKNGKEYYISDIYAEMIKDNTTIVAAPVSDIHCVGTPVQLKTFCIANGKDSVYKRFCFDLDGTLCTFPEKQGDYSTVRPIAKTIKLLKFLHKNGHTIIIQTARGMRSSGENPGAAQAKAYREVFSFLEREQIPFDEIYFGKPHADFYIDDLAVSPFGDIEKEIGFYDAVVEARSFNKVSINEVWTTKETNNPGEVYWYQNIPSQIEEYFPIVNQANTMWVNGKGVVQIETIKGIPYSYLFVNGSLTTADVDLLLDSIDIIHSCKDIPTDQSLFYLNYADKIQKRYTKNLDLYSRIDNSEFYFNKINDLLLNYQSSKMAIGGVCLGDPVFSNVFLCNNRKLKFIDMRGMLGDNLSLYGDRIYDYAKVYQSLNSYDFILSSKIGKDAYQKYIRFYFENHFITKFGKEMFKWLKIITSSHFFSLIPLHQDFQKQKKYFQCCVDLLKK